MTARQESVACGLLLLASWAALACLPALLRALAEGAR